MIKIEDNVSSVVCDICNKICVADASDLTVYEYSTYSKTSGKENHFCDVCSAQIDDFIKKIKTNDYLI